jgi:two-component system chemotaxis sensor kinase CheA
MEPGDQEFQRLFQIYREECDEHIQKLNDGLLALEREPQKAPIDEILRSAHSLKGASRMMGFKNLETLAHYLETLLTQLNRGEREATPATIEALYRDIDAVTQALGALIEGAEPPNIDALIDELRVAAGENAADMPAQTGPATEAQERVPAGSRAPVSRDGGGAAALSSIRVQTDRLDNLMNQAGELLVAKIEALDNLRQIEDTLDSLEEWRRRLARETHSLSFGRIERVGGDLSRALQRLSDNTRRLELLVDGIHEGVRDLRLLPLSTILEPFFRMVRDLSRELGKEVDLVLEGTSTRLDKKILEELREPLIHLVRNSIDHGIEPPEERERQGKSASGKLVISARQEGTKILVVVKDDGKGLDRRVIADAAVRKGIASEEEVRRWSDDEVLDLIFHPGFSTAAGVTEISGRGIGLDAVLERLENLKGSILTESKPGEGVTFALSLPLTLSTTHALLFQSGGDIFCLPTDALEKTLLLSPDDIVRVEGKATVVIDGTPLAFAWLSDVLNLPKIDGERRAAIPALLLRGGKGRVVFGVEALVGEEEIVVKALGKFFGHMPQLSGGTILGKGEIALILNPNELLRSISHQAKASAPVSVRSIAPRPAAKKRVLVVEDTLTTRTLEKNILEAAGFDVTTAVDGEDGLIKLYEKTFDIVVSDVQMPRLDGFALTERIKKDQRFKDLPVILVTALQTEADKRRGIEAGADAYLTKAVFDQGRFLEIVQRFA